MSQKKLPWWNDTSVPFLVKRILNNPAASLPHIPKDEIEGYLYKLYKYNDGKRFEKEIRLIEKYISTQSFEVEQHRKRQSEMEEQRHKGAIRKHDKYVPRPQYDRARRQLTFNEDEFKQQREKHDSISTLQSQIIELQMELQRERTERKLLSKIVKRRDYTSEHNKERYAYPKMSTPIDTGIPQAGLKVPYITPINPQQITRNPGEMSEIEQLTAQIANVSIKSADGQIKQIQMTPELFNLCNRNGMFNDSTLNSTKIKEYEPNTPTDFQYNQDNDTSILTLEINKPRHNGNRREHTNNTTGTTRVNLSPEKIQALTSKMKNEENTKSNTKEAEAKTGKSEIPRLTRQDAININENKKPTSWAEVTMIDVGHDEVDYTTPLTKKEEEKIENLMNKQ